MAEANERRSGGGQGEASPSRPAHALKTAAEQQQPAPERPITPLERRAGFLDKPSQAEGERETVEEDLRIQERRAEREREESVDRGGGGRRNRA
jgi:hypothetical protein